MSTDIQLRLADAERLAETLKAHAPAGCQVLNKAKDTRSITAPKTGLVAARIFCKPDATWFYLTQEQQHSLQDMGFRVEQFRPSSEKRRDKGKFRVHGLRSEHVDGAPDLFRAILMHSAQVRDNIRATIERA